MLEYHAAYFREPDGWFVVELVDFPGVFSQGKTLRSARFMIRDALRLVAECLVEDGGSLPKPNPKAKPTMGKKPHYVEKVRLKTRFQAPVRQ
jgi:predicted RNase H-like HicB family nuclease